PLFSYWHYNKTLKQIVKKSSLSREVLHYRTVGGELKETVKDFSDLVSSHTARRTFASNAYLMGIDPLDIMKITGHKSFNSFFKYIRCENLNVALKIATHNFFNINF
ncbi:MAG TPA: tyrosine-type recombinase/integrase, partial [Flavobacterium sp.]|nr:tyrosine-type recombinase/integrase [Flavobacterium sp.]